jgi:hypothetical protein
VWNKQSLRAIVFILSLALHFTAGTTAFAQDPDIGYHMDTHTVPPQDGESNTGIVVETAEPGSVDADPNGPGSKDRTANPGEADGGGTGGGAKAPGTQTPAVDTPPTANPPGTDAANADGGGRTSPGQTSPGQTTLGQAPDPSAAHPGDADPTKANPGDADAKDAKKPDHQTPWYKSLWNKVKQAGKGALAGGIGAAVVIGGALLVAAALGVTIGAPVLIGALVVGVVAGAVYALVSGDHFNFIKGIGIGGLAALTVITIGEMGIAAGVRGVISLFRSAGARGMLRGLASRSLSLLKGAFQGMKSGLLSFARGMTKAPLATMKSLVMSKTFATSFGLNVLGNYFTHMAANGTIPDFGETAVILAQSFVGALVLDKIFRIKLSNRFDITKLRRTQHFRPNALRHIFHGEVNVRGKAVGYHYEGIPNTPGKVIPGTETPPNRYGVYQAQVEVNGIPKTGNSGYSTFFPKNMSPQEIVDAINHAYSNKVHLTGNTYVGVAPNGMEIQMYLDASGQIISAFPIY